MPLLFLSVLEFQFKQGVIVMAVDGNEPLVFKVRVHEYMEHFLSVRKKYKEIYET